MRVGIIGAGAAGLVAAAEAARHGAEVQLLEKSNKIGVKILMSGGTRCNLTHDTDAKGITQRFRHAQRFLQPSVGAFSPSDVVRMFNRAGVATKVESTGKVFPQSDRAVHARDALWQMARDAGVKIQTGTSVTELSKSGDVWHLQTSQETFECDRVIVTSGGKSYPGCGTTGDAYAWLRKLGHTIITPRPALVPVKGGSPWTHDLSGITVDDCVAEVRERHSSGKRVVLASRRSSWLFTHFGFSGPAAMDVSFAITSADSVDDISLYVDLVPNITEEAIQATLSDRDGGRGRQQIAKIVNQWIPQRVASSLIELEPGLTGNQSLSQLSKSSRNNLVKRLKQLPLPVHGTQGFPKAEVTAGGVKLAEVNSKTLESRLVPGLFIAGEVLDVDGPIGGYNFQAAFSTGRAAGAAAAKPTVE